MSRQTTLRQRRDHPCGSVPVSGVHLSVWRCHEHGALWASVWCVTQRGDEDIETHTDASCCFGPFDGAADVESWLLAATRSVVTRVMSPHAEESSATV